MPLWAGLDTAVLCIIEDCSRRWTDQITLVFGAAVLGPEGMRAIQRYVRSLCDCHAKLSLPRMLRVRYMPCTPQLGFIVP